MSNFIEQCQSQQASLDEIDDFIDEWHEHPRGQSLHEFLGMTREEYSLWITDSSILPVIVSLHAQNRTIDDVLSKSPDAPRKGQKLIDWLKKSSVTS
jgi:hypothetical protein